MLVSKTFKTDPTDGLLTTFFPAQKVPSGFFHINIFNFGWKPHPGVSFSKANQWLQLTRISSYCTTTATNLTHLCQNKNPTKKSMFDYKNPPVLLLLLWLPVCWIFLKGYFLIGWLKCFLTQCCEKPKQKPKAKHIKMPTFEREGVKERRKGRKKWISKWREKERKKMNEWKSQRMSKNLEHFYLKNKIIF